jgi:exodeoxyribonuclease V gamma subunit
VPVQELLDVLSQTDEASGIQDTLFIRHPLQAFAPQYFDGQGDVPASFDANALKAARRLQGHPEREAVFAENQLAVKRQSENESAEMIDGSELVAVGDLRLLYERPWLLFLRRVGVGDVSVAEDSSDREPLVLDGLEYWQAGNTWLEQSLAGVPEESIAQQLIRTGSIPAGSAGNSVVRTLKLDASRIVASMQKVKLKSQTESLPVNLRVADVVLAGEISGWTGNTIHRGTFSKVSVKYAARLWVDHLVATAICNRILEPAVLVGRDGTQVTLSDIKPDEAFAHLETLVRVSQNARCYPLPFFINKEVAKPIWKNEVDFADRQSMTAYVAAARNSFVRAPFGKDSSGKNRPAPADEPNVRAAFAGLKPFDIRCDAVPALSQEGDRNLFAYLAETLCSPLVEHLEEFPG